MDTNVARFIVLAICKMMKKNAINRHELAIRTGIAYSRLCRALNPSNRQRLSFDDAEKICGALGRCLDDVLIDYALTKMNTELIALHDQLTQCAEQVARLIDRTKARF